MNGNLWDIKLWQNYYEFYTDLRSKATLPIGQNAADAVAASLCQYRLESKSVL